MSVHDRAERAAIKWAHESQGLETPTTAKGVRSTMAGIRRELGVAPKRKAPAKRVKTVVPEPSDG